MERGRVEKDEEGEQTRSGREEGRREVGQGERSDERGKETRRGGRRERRRRRRDEKIRE